MGRQGRTGGRTAAAHLPTEIKGQYSGCTGLVQGSIPLVVPNRFGQAPTHGIGRLAVIEQQGLGLPSRLAGGITGLDRGLGHGVGAALDGIACTPFWDQPPATAGTMLTSSPLLRGVVW